MSGQLHAGYKLQVTGVYSNYAFSDKIYPQNFPFSVADLAECVCTLLPLDPFDESNPHFPLFCLPLLSFILNLSTEYRWHCNCVCKIHLYAYDSL